jgi:hypothetical protein
MAAISCQLVATASSDSLRPDMQNKAELCTTHHKLPATADIPPERSLQQRLGSAVQSHLQSLPCWQSFLAAVLLHNEAASALPPRARGCMVYYAFRNDTKRNERRLAAEMPFKA